MDQLLGSPAASVAFIIFVVYLVLFYFMQRERSQVSRMRGPRRFSPSWSSGRRTRRRRSSRTRDGFRPRWSREETNPEDSSPSSDRKPSSDVDGK